MNAVEKLKAAIEKLETLKAETTPGPWTTDSWFPGVAFEYDSYWNLAGPEYTATSGVYLDGEPSIPIQAATADLIVTLHRTIDAQLAILRNAAEYFTDFPEYVDDLDWTLLFALADAILGGA